MMDVRRGYTVVALAALVALSHQTPAAAAAKHSKYQLPSTGVLSLADLEAFVAEERSYHPRNTFAAPFNEAPIENRAFHAEVPLHERSYTSTSGEWKYDSSAGTLTLIARVEGWTPETFMIDDGSTDTVAFMAKNGTPSGFVLADGTSGQRGYLGRTALGVKSYVHSYWNQRLAVGTFGSRPLGLPSDHEPQRALPLDTESARAAMKG